jgi:type VI secretion system protein ImpH
VLPDHYTEFVVARRRARDPAVAAFLDLFNHRSATLFYRGWARSRLPVRFEESARPFRDPVSRLLAALVGLGLDAQAERARQADGAVLGLAGRLGRKVRTPGAVRSLAQALVAVPASVEEFRGRWLPIPEDERTRLAQPRPGLNSFCRLGTDAVAGERVWDAQGGFRLRLGPMTLPEFRDFFTPDGSRARLKRALAEAVAPTLEFDLRLVLKREEVPRLQLGEPSNPAFLGQTTWLCATTPEHDRDDAILSASSA